MVWGGGSFREGLRLGLLRELRSLGRLEAQSSYVSDPGISKPACQIDSVSTSKTAIPLSIWCFFAVSSGASTLLNKTGPREMDASPDGSRRLA